MFGLLVTIMGVANILGRRDAAGRRSRWVRFWSGNETDVDADAFDYGVLGWVLVVVGIAILFFRPFS